MKPGEPSPECRTSSENDDRCVPMEWCITFRIVAPTGAHKYNRGSATRRRQDSFSLERSFETLLTWLENAIWSRTARGATCVVIPVLN